MNRNLIEQVSLAEAATSSDARSGVLEVEFITPGWGSSGYYSREVVEAAAPLFKVGTHLYLDHPTATEDAERPVRSVRDIAAVVTEAGTVDKTTGGIRGKVKATAPYRDLLTDETLMEHIGLSIRGSATDITVGEAEGRTGPIIEGLADVASVDFVTRAGRGGKVLQVLESVQPSLIIERAIARGLSEATADERRQQLSDVVRTAYAGDQRYAWVQDFDESTVWFQASAENERSRVWEQTYSVADDDMSVTLTGERTEVRAITKYVPVTRSDSTTPTTEASKEDTMGNIQIDEAEHRSLVERAGRVDTLEERATTAEQERDTARRDLAERYRVDAARRIVSERAAAANVAFTPLEERGLMAQLPVNEDGTLNEATFTTTVDEAATSVAESRGVGQVHGFGGTIITQTGPGDIAESDIDSAVAGAFGRTIKEA